MLYRLYDTPCHVETFVSERVAQLRMAKGVSARDMSLSIGQNVNYINALENRKMEPSLTVLYYICDYFKITPHEFFDEGNRNPPRLNDFINDVKRLDDAALFHLSNFIKALTNKEK
jgi:transcriptional regulator with XRE-family HTH domain